MLAAVPVAVVGWLGFEAVAAKSHLEQARDSAQKTKDLLLSGNTDGATRLAEDAQSQARQARAATHSLPWSLISAIPVVGSPLKTTQQLSDVVLGLADDVLLPATQVGGSLSPDKLVNGNSIDVAVLRDQEPRLAELSTAASRLDASAQAITNPAYVGAIRDARSQLQEQTSKLSQLLGNTALAAKLVPSMFGGDGPRTYLMGFQTPAEARGTGGLLGGFGVLRFEDGRATVDTLAPNTELAKASAAIDLGPEFDKTYQWTNPYTDFRNSNLSPHFPYAAEIWQSMWEGQTKQQIDGVIAVDPIALSYLLGAVGPITMPDGELITEQNVVELTMSTAYARFPPEYKVFGNGDVLTLPDRRKKYLQTIAGEAVKKLLGQSQSPRKILDALGKAASEGRIAVWSADPADQLALEETPLAHIVPDDDAPYAHVVVNNLAGNKMDYYLRREIEVAADGCDEDRRNSTITVRLTNTSNGKALPDAVAGLSGLIEGLPVNLPDGSMVSSVRVLATRGAQLMSVTSNGERIAATVNSERGHPSFEVQVAIPPGQSGDLVFRLTEPTTPGEARVPVQPLIDAVTPRVSVPACR